MKYNWLDVAKQLQSIAQAGLTYCENMYDIDRYEQIRAIGQEIIHDFTKADMETIRNLFSNENGYQTPKVDIRGVVFSENKILMVREKIDNCWALPGGWADVGYSPKEVAVKEIWEEAGLKTQAVRLLSVFDYKHHPHPPSPYHVYKFFILCRIVGGKAQPGYETSDVFFYERDNLPQLSLPRNTKQQLKLMFEYHDNPEKDVICN